MKMVKHILLKVMFVSLMFFSPLALSSVSKEGAWPVTNACEPCFNVYLSGHSQVYFSFPVGEIGSINLLGIDGVAFSSKLGREKYSSDEELMFLLLDDVKTTGGMNTNGIYKALGVIDLVGFFSTLHNSSISSQEATIARKVMGVAEANSYTQYKSPILSAYWIASQDVKNQFLYILVEGSQQSIQVGGTLTPDLVKLLLAAVRVKDLS